MFPRLIEERPRLTAERGSCNLFLGKNPKVLFSVKTHELVKWCRRRAVGSPTRRRSQLWGFACAIRPAGLSRQQVGVLKRKHRLASPVYWWINENNSLAEKVIIPLSFYDSTSIIGRRRTRDAKTTIPPNRLLQRYVFIQEKRTPLSTWNRQKLSIVWARKRLLIPFGPWSCCAPAFAPTFTCLPQ